MQREKATAENPKQNAAYFPCMLMELFFAFCILQTCAAMESAAAASEKEVEEDSRPSDPRGDRAPSHSVTLEPERTDRAERPLSSEYGSSHCALLPCFSSVSLHLSSAGLPSSRLCVSPSAARR